ncbi:hypothetical protein BZG01_00130 [Labilibaculum manganireducens]|uniref:Uncharacterized protein n=1 Tax=Labilibaculum manganireducens TaxID=1940525 RepID=A0A2N3IGD0_9BACT|nr:hypothetical protein [Labilibaculum manganireducens]PKQ69380.1 hypothetical protein BZG01_00130 [Labilibaculum manganireducens]
MEYEKLFAKMNQFTINKFEDDDFEMAGKVCDWRNHVPDALKKDWKFLTQREKEIIFLMAEQQASAEKWD